LKEGYREGKRFINDKTGDAKGTAEDVQDYVENKVDDVKDKLREGKEFISDKVEDLEDMDITRYVNN